MNRRVVITGIGAVTPIGNSAPAYFDGLRSGRCGIGPITRFDTTDYKAKVCAEVKDFDPSACCDCRSGGSRRCGYSLFWSRYPDLLYASDV